MRYNPLDTSIGDTPNLQSTDFSLLVDQGSNKLPTESPIDHQDSFIGSAQINEGGIADYDQALLDELIPQNSRDSYKSPLAEELNFSFSDQTTPYDSQLNEIDILQAQILNDPNFDFNLMDASAAGNQSSDNSASNDKTTSSPSYVEATTLVQSSIDKTSFSIDPTLNTDTNLPAQPNDVKSHYLVDQSQYTPVPTAKVDNVRISLNEDLVISKNGMIEGDFENSAQTIQSEYGSLNISNTGHWQFTLDNQSTQIQALRANESVTDEFFLHTDSGSQILFTINIHGTNDRPIIEGDAHQNLQALSNKVVNQEPITATGSLRIEDKDLNEAHFIEDLSLDTSFGNASIMTNGDWHYELDSQHETVLNLREGETIVDHLNVQTIDGSSQTIDITIYGANDKPLLSGNNRHEINIDHSTSAADILHISDPDFAESHFIEQAEIRSELGFGYGSINEKGEWQFELNSDKLASHPILEGSYIKDFFTVTTADGTEQSIIIKIFNAVTTNENPNDLLSTSPVDTGIVDFSTPSEEQLALDALMQPSHQDIGTQLNSNYSSNANLADTYINNLNQLGSDSYL